MKERFRQIIRFCEKILKVDLLYVMKGGFWITSGNLANAFVNFLLSIAFASFVSKDTFGIYKYILSIVAIAGSFSLSGMNTAVTQAVARGLEGTFLQSIKVQIKWIFPQLFILIGIAVYYGFRENYTYFLAFLVAAFFASITSIANTYIAYVNGKKDFKQGFIYSILSNSLYGAAMIGCLFFFPNILPLTSTYFVIIGVTTLFCCIHTFQKYKPNNTYEAKDIGYGKHLSLINFFTQITLQIDSVLIYHFLGPAELAIFSFATIVPEKVRYLFSFIPTIALPKFSNQSYSKKDTTHKTIQLVLLATILCIGYIVLAPTFFAVFFPAYQESVIYSQVFSLSFVAIIATLPTTKLLAEQQKESLYKVSIYTAIIKLSLLFFGIYFFGIWGAIGAKIIAHGTQTILVYLFSIQTKRTNSI